MEYFRVQLNIPVLYHVQSIQSPCICVIAVMIFEPTSAFTFQFGSKVAAISPKTPNKARIKAKNCRLADVMMVIFCHLLSAFSLVEMSDWELRSQAVAICVTGRKGEGRRSARGKGKEISKQKKLAFKIRAI